jgi:hypothetical protein
MHSVLCTPILVDKLQLTYPSGLRNVPFRRTTRALTAVLRDALKRRPLPPIRPEALRE